MSDYEESDVSDYEDTVGRGCHYIVTKTYDGNGECVAVSQSFVPGPYEPDEMTKKYWKWLDERRNLD